MTPEDKVLEEMRRIYPDRMEGAEFYEGRGCPVCNYSKYRGRCAISEVMMMTDPIRAMVVGRQPANLIKDQAMKEGMVTLRQDGWLRVLEGRTSVEEVLRVAGRLEE